MINLAMNQTFHAEEICLRGELSGAARSEAGANRFAAETIRIVRLKSGDRAQLKAAQRIEVSLRYMMQNLNKPMKVPALSAMVGLSESSFFALFKSATGRTPLDFFIRARMHRAGELLAETMLQIKEVAAILGYDDQFYFSRMFKSVYGVSPREYRVKMEESPRSNLKQQPIPEPFSVEYWPSNLPRHATAAAPRANDQVLDDSFQSASSRVNTCQQSRCDFSAQPGPICSVSVQQ